MKVVVLANTRQKAELMAQLEVGPDNIVWGSGVPITAEAEGAAVCIDLLFDNSPGRIKELQQLKPSLLVISASSAPQMAPGMPYVRINGWNTFLKRRLIEATGPEELRERTETLFALFNKQIEWTADIPGFISLRIVTSIINEAYFALDEKVSTKEEIDTAMKLGTNYPFGPFEWSREIGLQNIYHLLNELGQKEKRYQPASLLKQEAGI